MDATQQNHRVERVGGGVEVWISDQHTFGTDSFLLSDFARSYSGQARRGELACDLGSGCGIVPLLWFRDAPMPRQVYAVELQPAAIALLERSVERSGLDGRLLPVRADLRKLRGLLPFGAFDLVTCNPPYNAAGAGVPSRSRSDLVARHETHCTLHDVCGAAERLLRFGGRLCLCQLPERLVDVLAAMRDHRIEPKRLRMVQQTARHTPWLVLVEGKRGARPGLRIEAPLVLREGTGPSAEMDRIYRYYGKV